MKSRLVYIALSLALMCAFSGAAYADYSFAGTGSSGILVSPSETWAFNADFPFGGTQSDWGSPGVDLGTTAYGEAQAAFGMVVNFTGGGPIDVASVALGNGSACAGTTTGGTTFCTVTPTDIWQAFVTGPDSIEFLAQDPSFFLSAGQLYFVNVFFDGATPTGFTGSWLTTFTPTPSPEPGTLVLLGSSVLAFIGFARRRLVA